MSISIEQVENNGALDPSGVQRELRKLGRAFPLGKGQIQNGAVGTAALAANAATKIHIATPTTSGPTTASTASPPTAVVPEMSITADFGGNPIIALFSADLRVSAAAFVGVGIADAVGGFIAASERTAHTATASGAVPASLIYAFTPSTGSRTLQVRWRTTAGTVTNIDLRRQFVVLELRR